MGLQAVADHTRRGNKEARTGNAIQNQQQTRRSNTANASSAMQEVMNHAQVQIGIRASVMPLVRRSSVVAIKFKERAEKQCRRQRWTGPTGFGRALPGSRIRTDGAQGRV